MEAPIYHLDKVVYNTYNMGLGMVLAVDPADADRAISALREAGEEAYVVGEVENGDKEVVLK